MATFDRVLTGRPAHLPGEPWNRGVRAPGHGGLLSGPAQPEPAASDPAAAARLAELELAAEERGYAAGRETAERELAAAISAAGALAHSLETAVPRDVDMVARTVAELAVLITRRILAAELGRDPAVLLAAIEAGLRQAVGASVIHVELPPSALAAVEAAWAARHGTRHRGITWSFAADPTLPDGGCRLRTEHGIVDAGFESQLSEVAAALDAAIPGYLASALGPTAGLSGPAAGADGAGAGSRDEADLATLDRPVRDDAALTAAALAADLAELDLVELGLDTFDVTGGGA